MAFNNSDNNVCSSLVVSARLQQHRIPCVCLTLHTFLRYHYTHETRMLIMGTGAPGAAYVQAYQFVAAGSIVLPPFAVAVLQGLEDGVSMSGGLKAAGRNRTDDLRLDADGTGSSGFGTPRSGTPQLPVSSRDLGSSVPGDSAGLGVLLEVQGKQMHLLKVCQRLWRPNASE